MKQASVRVTVILTPELHSQIVDIHFQYRIKSISETLQRLLEISLHHLDELPATRDQQT
jgi:hypothetical protein